jgi:hypothetical protein
MNNENPVFTDQFYIKKFMEIQQQNIILYKRLLKIKNNPEISAIVDREFGLDFFDVLKDSPA